MNNENNKLGRGLASLLSSRKDVEKTDSSNINIVPITSIRSNKNQPRKNFKEQELEELAKSIKSKGILQPIIVRKTNQDGLIRRRFDVSGVAATLSGNNLGYGIVDP